MIADLDGLELAAQSRRIWSGSQLRAIEITVRRLDQLLGFFGPHFFHTSSSDRPGNASLIR